MYGIFKYPTSIFSGLNFVYIFGIIFIGGILLLIINTYIAKLEKDISKDISKEIFDDIVNNDTVIVASGGSFDWNMNNKVYFHPKSRSFRDGIKYLGFYYKGKIMGYGEIEKIEDNKKLNELVKSANEKGYEVNTKVHDFFSCAKDFKVTNIDWSSLGRSPVMSKQYISVSELV